MAEGDIIASTVVDGAPFFVCGACAVGECCLYPAPMPDTPLYPTTDLPATIVINGNTLLLVAAASGHYNDYQYGDWNDSAGPVIYAVGVENVWRYNEGTNASTSGCLVNSEWLDHSASSEDEFNDSYTVVSDIITRTTPCIWTGAKTGGGTWSLDYGITTPFKFHLTSTGGSPTSDDKDDPQSSPDGTYGAIIVT